MRFYSCLALIGVVSATDCTGTYAWDSNKNYQANAKVIYEGSLYTASYWATSSNLPGGGVPWNLVGACDEGTDSGTGPLVDCSDAVEWKLKDYDYETVHTVYHNNQKFKQNFWAGSANEPGKETGDSVAWQLIGTCEDGTAGSGPTGNAIDCSTYDGWNGGITYPIEKKSFVHYDGRGYQNKYWTESDRPDLEKAWIDLGPCKEGTDTRPAPPSGYELSTADEKLLCSCCNLCAREAVTGPECLDKFSTEDTCYFTWCPKYDTFDAEQCASVKAKGTLNFYHGEITEGKKEWPTNVYCPYFDGGLAKYPPLTQLAEQYGVNHFVVAFVVAPTVKSIEGCHGAFAGSIPVQQGPITWNETSASNNYLYEELSNLRDAGGDFIISFGGASNIELADSANCQAGDPVENLVGAYSEVVDFLKLTHIDFDIEGQAYASINREKGWAYRFAAVKKLSEKYPDLNVWWTLPVLPTGLTPDGYTFIQDLFASGARWDRFNLMTMDYGDDTVCPGNKMSECELSAVDATAQQFFDAAEEADLLDTYGWKKVKDVYPRLGSTPMIGMNDLTNEVYTLADAKASLKKHKKNKLGLISNWSVGRDQPCPGQTNVDCLCSSLDEQTKPYQFLQIFADFTSE